MVCCFARTQFGQSSVSRTTKKQRCDGVHRVWLAKDTSPLGTHAHLSHAGSLVTDGVTECSGRSRIGHSAPAQGPSQLTRSSLVILLFREDLWTQHLFALYTYPHVLNQCVVVRLFFFLQSLMLTVKDIVDEATNPWGVTVSNVEV
jgi:hypothetical protein